MRLTLAVLLCAALFSAPARGQYYISPSTSQAPQVGAPVLAGGAMTKTGSLATNTIPFATTNNSVWSAPLDILKWNTFTIQATCTQASNNAAYGVGQFTNWLFLYPSCDGVNFDTNSVIKIGPWLPPTGQSNAMIISNIAPALAAGQLARYWQAGWGCVGTNSASNCVIQPFFRGMPSVVY